MQRIRGEGPKDKQPSADDATRILPTSDPKYGETQLMPPGATFGVADRRGAIIGSAGAAEGSPASSSGAPGARAPMPDETVYIPSEVNAADSRSFDPVVGWVVVRKGPGRGRSCPVFYGQNSIGRGADQRISLDFGDQRISRQGHAYLIYDDLAQKFYIRDGGKSNIVRHNGQLVMAATELHDHDEISIGGTTLLFVALCGPEFDWLTTEAQKGANEAGKAMADESDQ